MDAIVQFCNYDKVAQPIDTHAVPGMPRTPYSLPLCPGDIALMLSISHLT